MGGMWWVKAMADRGKPWGERVSIFKKRKEESNGAERTGGNSSPYDTWGPFDTLEQILTERYRLSHSRHVRNYYRDGERDNREK